uniref:Uncharacterized protein n=1 Tax=Anas platyrhynchos TaxID=8839 RepID=A0A8B9QZN9_ANAPL
VVLTRLKKNSNLAELEVGEVRALRSHVAAAVPSCAAVPSGILFLVKFLLDVLRQGLSGAINSILLRGCLRGSARDPAGSWGLGRSPDAVPALRSNRHNT